jgi:DNA-directed RNA polymerase subunit RPC12/RpoP
VNETIRDRIKRRVRWCIAIALSGWLIFPLAAASSGGKPRPELILLGFVFFGGAILALQWAVKCPRCSARMGQEIGMRVGLSVFRKPPNFCPYCGVNLDQPVAQAQGAVPSQNPIK